MSDAPKTLVGIIMGSKTDLEYMSPGSEMLAAMEIGCEVRDPVGPSHPRRGCRVLIDGSKAWPGGAHRVAVRAHLPGVIAASTLLPVIGVPIPSTPL